MNLGQLSVKVVSKPGLPDWDQLPPSTELLAQYPKLHPTDHILLFGCHHGALPVVLAHSVPDGQLFLTDNNSTALEMTRMTLNANNITSAIFLADADIPRTLDRKINRVFIQNPKGRKLARRWLLQANQVLDLGGDCYLAGSNQSGIQSVIKDAQGLFGDGYIQAYKKGNRLAHLVKKSANFPLPEWANIPGIAPGTWVEFSITLSNHTYHIHSLPGVFSYDHLDVGTSILLSVANIPVGARVLDVGCGYGIIGMFAAVNGASWVDFVDNDLLAVASCKESLALNGITNASIFAGDLLDSIDPNKDDLILSNPPFHAGQGVDYQIAEAMITQAYHALNVGGKIIIVANRFIRYDHQIQAIFGNISYLAETGKFHVLSSVKSS